MVNLVIQRDYSNISGNIGTDKLRRNDGSVTRLRNEINDDFTTSKYRAAKLLTYLAGHPFFIVKYHSTIANIPPRTTGTPSGTKSPTLTIPYVIPLSSSHRLPRGA